MGDLLFSKLTVNTNSSGFQGCSFNTLTTKTGHVDARAAMLCHNFLKGQKVADSLARYPSRL